MEELSKIVDNFKLRVDPRYEMYKNMREESKETDSKIDKIVSEIARDFGMRRNFNGFFDDLY